MRRQPADPQAGQGERLRHDAERDPAPGRIGAGRQPIRRIELESPVDLVHEQVRAGGLGQLDEAVEGRSVGQHPGRVVRQVDDDQAGRRGQLPPEEVEIDRPVVRLVELVQRDVDAVRPGDLVQALVAGPGDDGVVARPDEHVHQAEDRLLGPGKREHLGRVDRLVQRGDLTAQEWMTGRFGVAEPEAVPQRTALVVRQVEQLAHRVALDVRGAQQVPGVELPAGEVPLEREVGDPHRGIMPHGEPAGRSAGNGLQVRGDRPDRRLAETVDDQEPARVRPAVHRHGPRPVVVGDERAGPVAEGDGPDLLAGRDAAVGGRAERALPEDQPGIARTVIADLEPSATREPVPAVIHEPAVAQHRTVDGPVDRGRHRGEEVAVLVAAAAGRDRPVPVVGCGSGVAAGSGVAGSGVAGGASVGVSLPGSVAGASVGAGVSTDAVEGGSLAPLGRPVEVA